MEILAISLAKALKIKNRLAGRLSKTQSTIQMYNSLQEGRDDGIDIKELDQLASQLSQALVVLKTDICRANSYIYREIIEIKEKQVQVNFLNSINTRHGNEYTAYQNTPINYVATIRKQDVDSRVKQLEKEIDDLQDRIDAYNAVPERLRIDKAILDLAG